MTLAEYDEKITDAINVMDDKHFKAIEKFEEWHKKVQNEQKKSFKLVRELEMFMTDKHAELKSFKEMV